MAPWHRDSTRHLEKKCEWNTVFCHCSARWATVDWSLPNEWNWCAQAISTVKEEEEKISTFPKNARMRGEVTTITTTTKKSPYRETKTCSEYVSAESCTCLTNKHFESRNRYLRKKRTGFRLYSLLLWSGYWKMILKIESFFINILKRKCFIRGVVTSYVNEIIFISSFDACPLAESDVLDLQKCFGLPVWVPTTWWL